jgi:hypothetical protein
MEAHRDSPLACRALNLAPALPWRPACRSRGSQSSGGALSWRREISAELGALAFDRLLSAPVDERRPRRLLESAWEVAEELGWAKLYDAHYVALARMLDMPLLTLDGRLRRGAAGVVQTLGPTEL